MTSQVISFSSLNRLTSPVPLNSWILWPGANVSINNSGALNRYALEPLDRASYESSAYWWLVAKIVGVIAIILIGTVACVYCFYYQNYLLGTLIEVVTYAVGDQFVNFCDPWIDKKRRWSAVSAYFEQNHFHTTEPDHMRKLWAHHDYCAANLTNPDDGTIAPLPQSQDDFTNRVREAQSISNANERAARVREIYASAQDAANSKLWCAYFQMLINNDARITSERAELCSVQIRPFETFAEGEVTNNGDVTVANAFACFISNPNAYSLYHILNASSEELQLLFSQAAGQTTSTSVQFEVLSPVPEVPLTSNDSFNQDSSV